LLTGEGTLNITAANGVTVEYRATGDLDQDIAQLSQAPGLAWMADLKNDPNVDWVAVREVHKEWLEESEGLSGPASAVIAIAIAYATSGLGAQLAGLAANSTAGLASSAAFSSLASQAVISSINNQGDLGAIFKDLTSLDFIRTLAVASLTAGLTAEFGGGLLENRPFNIGSPEFTQHLKNELITAGIKTGVSTTLGGEDFNDSLLSNLQFAGSAVFGAQFSKGIGTLIKSGEINKAQQLIAHALVGCASAAIGGADCGGAAIGSALGEAVADLAHNGLGVSQEQAATIGRYAALASALATADEALDVTYTNLAASNAIANNFLLPDEKLELVERLENCGNYPACRAWVSRDYKAISEVRDEQFEQAFDTCQENPNNCDAFYKIHYDLREKLTIEGNEFYLANANEFKELPNYQAIYHTYVRNEAGDVVDVKTDQVNYTKYIHPIIGYEIVLDENKNIVTDPLNAGTYNLYNPKLSVFVSPLINNATKHLQFDTATYREYGNSVSDPTTIQDRVDRGKYFNNSVFWSKK